MEFKNTAVFNIEGALRGMRNPHNSWKHIDSSFGLADLRTIDEILDDSYPDDSINFENSKNNIILHQYTLFYCNSIAIVIRLGNLPTYLH